LPSIPRLGGYWRRSFTWKFAAYLAPAPAAFLAGSLLHPAAGVALSIALLILASSAGAIALLAKRRAPQLKNAVFFEGFDKVTRSAGVRIWEWDVVRNTMQFSGDRAELYGTEVNSAKADADDVMLGKVHPEDRPRYRQEFIRALKGEAPMEIEYRVKENDGTVRPVQLRGEVFRNEKGRAIRVVGLTIDMSAQVRAATLLAEQAEQQKQLLLRLKLATETAGISIWDSNLETQEFVADDSFWVLFGVPPSRNSNQQDCIHIDDRSAVMGALRAALGNPAADAALSVRHRTANPRPEPQHVQTHMRIQRDLEGAATRVIGVTWDVTKEVLHAAELEHKAAHESALIERLNVTTKAAGIAPWEFDIKTNCFSWHGPRPPCFGMDDVPLKDYFREIFKIVLPEDRDIMITAPVKAIESNADSY
jgi:PAS domain S-box-containing protein